MEQCGDSQGDTFHSAKTKSNITAVRGRVKFLLTYFYESLRGLGGAKRTVIHDW